MRALVAEDDRGTRLILERLLTRWGYETVLVSDGVAALEEMNSENPPRLVLMDWVMPRMDGLEVCRRLRDQETSDPPYIIFLTAKGAAEDMARALDAGASDCIRKPFDRDELLARIRVGERTLTLQTELNDARREMTNLAMYDSLTEVYNRRATTERLNEELARNLRSGGSLSIGIADLDEFKSINDTWGHEAGDWVIKSFVQGVQATMRSSDVLGRFGGEEFLIIAPNHNVEEINTLSERIRRTTEQLRVAVGDGDIGFTVSIGVAAARPGESLDCLLRRADVALYQAKRNGKNQVCFAGPTA